MAHLPWDRSNPNKCASCAGCGKIVLQVQSDRYSCGFVTEARTCTLCMGTGRNMPSYPDSKLAAAGDAR